ncbi:MAG: hypothetical protein D6681_05145 [Calditrichaeota bacterium]|nr:MAG: hypothetical protein D6681_05145 [Calditrichota bacterium]
MRVHNGIGVRLLYAFWAIVSIAFAGDGAGVRQFRGNPTHTFYGTGEVPATEPQILWSFRTGQSYSGKLTRPWEGLGWTGQPAVCPEEDRMVVYIAALDGYIYALDFRTGELLRRSPQRYYIIKSSPAVTDRYIIFGSWDNCVHVLDRFTFRWVWADTAIWTASASYDFDSSPTVEGDHLYIGGEDGYVRRIRLGPEFRREWIYPHSAPTSPFTYGNSGKPYVGIESSVAVWRDRLVVGTGRGTVLILNKRNGHLLKQIVTGDDTDSSPVIDTTDSSFYIGVEKDFTDKRGGLYKFSLSGEQRWFFPTGAKGVFSTAALDSHRVVFTGDDGYLYALRKRDGHLLWKTRLADGSWCSPILVNGRIVVGDYAGYLYGVEAASGHILWRKKLGNYIIASPVIWEGVILIGTRDGYIHALR